MSANLNQLLIMEHGSPLWPTTTLLIMSIKTLAWNSQSLKPKIPELTKLIEKNKYNLILISETWLNEKIEIKIPNFYCYRNDRKSICSKNSLDIHGPDGMTVFPSKENPSIVEFAISKNISGISEIKVINDLSSDHNPISFEIPSKIIINPR